MTEVTLIQILTSREERVIKQKNILDKFGYPIISFTMNIAGPIKTSPLIERAFFEGINLLCNALSDKNIVYQDSEIKVTGCEAIFSVNADAAEIKKICTQIEENYSIGRLFDMDVIDTAELKLERTSPRGCIVCGRAGRECSAGRLHSVEALQSATKEIIEKYFFNNDKEYISNLAVKSLLDEVYTTPKPGLVDCRNNGSHSDMDVKLFEKSANSLKSYFGECFAIGHETKELSCDKALLPLRKAGITAEQTMYKATGGVNTHKGAIYSLGLICASIGRLWKAETPFANSEDICQESGNFVKDSLRNDFEKADTSTAGVRLYKNSGITGIRGEAASGFESVLKIGLPNYENLLSQGLSQNDAGVITLLHFVANIKDTNLYHRGGEEGAQFAKQIAGGALKHSAYERKLIEDLDDEFIKLNLSPGGCADLLAITYFLYNIKH